MTNRETPPLRMIGDRKYVNYSDILKDIRLAFPQPIADPIHNSYFVHSIMRALDQVDELKTHLPMLDSIIPADFEAARQTTYGDPIVALKSFILSPFVNETDVETVVAKVLEAREKVR